ncbi:hypothetical protein E2986_12126 [Frieseomelitta varia]|uniref:Uncharacterized protein n=1 Tax=Frieseomelitta varia TaxID=561572 RepID=A0A833REN3_9HYME|nr:hypothetical protein E2986_12126 [Frieseomelitta varia]
MSVDVGNAEGETDIVPCDYISSTTLMHKYPRLEVANFCPYFKQGSISVDGLEYNARRRCEIVALNRRNFDKRSVHKNESSSQNILLETMKNVGTIQPYIQHQRFSIRSEGTRKKKKKRKEKKNTATDRCIQLRHDSAVLAKIVLLYIVLPEY